MPSSTSSTSSWVNKRPAAEQAKNGFPAALLPALGKAGSLKLVDVLVFSFLFAGESRGYMS
jgi:hypothetical protein